MAELTTPSLANMRSMMAELFVWKENKTVIREVKTRLCKACNTPPFSGLDAEGCGTLGFCERSPMPSLTCQTSRLTSNEIFPICLCKSWKFPHAGKFSVTVEIVMLKGCSFWEGEHKKLFHTEQRKVRLQAHNTELSSFSQDTDLQEDPQITANIKLNPANNSSVVVLLK